MSANPIDEAVRAQFEAWARPKWRHPDDFDQRIGAPRGTYNNLEIQSAWEAWQALTAAQQQGQAVACGGCGNADPEKVCIGCLHPFAAPPSAPVGVEALHARADEIERAIALGEMDAMQTFTQMRQLLPQRGSAIAQQPAAVDGEAVERAVAWVSTADIAPFVGAPQMAEFWGTVTLASGPGDGRTVPLYLTEPPSALVGAEDIEVLKRLRAALHDAAMNGWWLGVEVLDRVIAALAAQHQETPR